jgi:AcrR family transcriptional regulator
MTPRYKGTERDKARNENRRALLDAAIEEFSQHGYDSANINRISRSAGFAKGTIYNYFSSKRDLMLALIEDISAHHYGYIARVVLQESDAEKRVVCFYSTAFDYVSEYLPRGLVMVNNLFGPNNEFKQTMFQAYSPMFRLVEVDVIAYGVEQGSFREVDPAPTSGMLMNIYLGVASQVNQQGKPWLSADQVVDFVLHALRR